jgi:hypothetical protein
MNRFGRVVREGRWRYAGTIESAVRIRESDTRFGSGDYEDPPDVREDRAERCYYVDWIGAGTNLSSAVSGPFDTLAAAETSAAEQSGGTLSWTPVARRSN